MPIPEMMPVSSNNVAALGYDESELCAYVEFRKGGLYVYRGVSAQEFENLRTATSIGTHLGRYFKNVYPYERIG